MSGPAPLVGPWWAEDDLARRQFKKLLPQRRPRRKRRRAAEPPAPPTPVQQPPQRRDNAGVPRFRASRLTVEARKKKNRTDASESSLSDSDSDPDFLVPDTSDDDEKAEDTKPVWQALTPLADWYREVSDGMERLAGEKPLLEKYQSPAHYLDVLRSEMLTWVQKLQLSGVDAAAVASLCLDLWIKVHSAPAWRRRWDKTVYSPSYHVLCVLSEMRCPGGLRIRVHKLRQYNTRHRYESPPLCVVVAVPHDPNVELGMPLKKDLARRFNEIKALDSRERVSTTSTATTTTTHRKNTFRWDNKRFSKCQTTLRLCLDDYYRVSFHFPT